MSIAHAEKKMKQTTIPYHTSSSAGRLPEVLMGPGFLNPKVNTQEFVGLDFMTAEAHHVVLEMSSADKLKILGELHLRCASDKLTEEVLARNNELMETNNKLSTENGMLRRRVEELVRENKKFTAGREKAMTELGKMD
ncbi:hypothetical protein Fmac_029410 [Flemingia macrophylla]|uniref:Uncharacterized protein n=1 Tax=Flemingia macrophylla TaxID=520843 RepID=A0ABD1LA89_9FABA